MTSIMYDMHTMHWNLRRYCAFVHDIVLVYGGGGLEWSLKGLYEIGGDTPENLMQIIPFT